MRPSKHAKIVATLGPASDHLQTIRALFDAGADVFRLNFSHGRQEDRQRRLQIIREVERQGGRPIGVLSAIRQIRGVEILGSRGDPTVVAEVLLVNGEIARAFTGQSVSTMATAMQRLPREGKAAG